MRRQETLVKAYLERLRQEAQELHDRFPTKLETIYFGGGTPSHLSDQELEHVVSTLQITWGFPASKETTLEADPLTFDNTRLKFFKMLGFDRLSIGLQSTQDDVLAFLGRAHTAKEGLSAIEMALSEGFSVSADLITAVTGQDTAKDLHTLAQTGVGHISVYSLSIEPYTPFDLRQVKVDEEKDLEDFLLTKEVLNGYGFERYEVSSYAKEGQEAVHNQRYWHGEYFLNLGPSAAGFLPRENTMGIRVKNPAIKNWLAQEAPESTELNKTAFVEDLFMTALRTKRGLDLDWLSKRTNMRIWERYKAKLAPLIGLGLLKKRNNTLYATEKGVLQLNGVLKQLTQL